MEIRLLCIHLSTCWRSLHLLLLVSSFLFQPAVALPTAVNGRPSEISDFKCSVSGFPSNSTQMKNILHFGYNAGLINFIFCSSSRSLEHFIHSLILINYYCNMSIFLLQSLALLSASTSHCKIPTEHTTVGFWKQMLQSKTYGDISIIL